MHFGLLHLLMRYGVGLIGWLAAGIGAAHAQQAPATAADTLQAVHRLFQARRTGGVVFGLLGGVYVGTGIATAAESQQPTASYAAPVYSAVSLGTGVPLLAVGLTKLLRFSTRREQRILLDYQAGRPLPWGIRRKLKPRYFKTA